jgi:hypothetical protein
MRLGIVTPANWTGENKCDECVDTETLIATVKRHTTGVASDSKDAPANRKSQLPGAAYSHAPCAFLWNTRGAPRVPTNGEQT